MKKIVVLEIAIAAVLFIGGLCLLLGGKPGTTEFQKKTHRSEETTVASVPEDTQNAEATDSATAPTESDNTQLQRPEALEITWKTLPEGRQISARQAFVYDCQNQEYLYIQGEETEQVWMASITKLFAIHVASRYLNPDEEILIESGPLSKVSANSSTAGLRSGEVLTASQLYVGSLISSGNDAAYVLATVAGRRIAEDPELTTDEAIAGFVEEMNREAAELGMTGTHFTNPDGYHDAEHYTCPRDLVTIARLALENEAVSHYGPLVQADITPVSGYEKSWRNLNLLVDENSQYYCPYAVGLKTGYTGAAGNCLQSAFDIDGHQYIIGTFGCPDESSRFDDTLQLFNDMVINRVNP